jgi:hypothetical protein
MPPKKLSFKINDRVWLRTAGEEYTIGDEPGRVIDNAGPKVTVDWGDDVPTQEIPEDLIGVIPEDGQENVFENMQESPNPLFSDEEFPEDQTAMTANPVTPIETLKSASFADMMQRHVAGLDAEETVYHVGTGLKGVIQNRASDGRYNVKFGEKIATLWPFELTMLADK